MKTSRLIGAHMPTAGGLGNSLIGGKAIGCTAVQVFTCSPRQWTHPPLDPAKIDSFRQAHEETAMPFVCAHDSYLINLAAPDEAILEKSRLAFKAELARADMLGIPWLVTHMGAHLGTGDDVALGVLVDSIRRVLDETDDLQTGIAIETTAGQGTTLGYRFEHVARVLDEIGHHTRLGVCLDTCHIYVAGYDIRTPETYAATTSEFGRLVGFDRLKIIHANDAKKPLGSKVDRHEHIGEGEIGIDAFNWLVNDPRIQHVPMIVETPEAETMHAVNVAKLQSLVQAV
jgi:deoxyribonuclease-4